MSKKKSASPWGRMTPRKPSRIVQTTVPINRMGEFKEEEARAVTHFSLEALAKEQEIYRAEGPHSIPEPHYAKSVKAIPYPTEDD